MVQTNQELEIKDFLQRVYIKTMRKDLKRLREEDAAGERKKIKNLNLSAVQNPTPEPQKTVLQPTPKPQQSPNPTPNPESTRHVVKSQLFTRQNSMYPGATPKQNSTGDNIKKEAREGQKQQLFLLQSQLDNLHEEIILVRHKREMENSQKNKFLAEEKNWQKKIDDMHAKGTLSAHADDQEKKNWAAERELLKLQETIKKLSENILALDHQESSIQKEMAQIEEKRAMLRGDITITTNVQAAGKIPSEDQQQFKTSSPETWQQKTPQKTYLKDASESAKQTLAAGAKTEEARRKKFMEDVEKWAASN